MSYSEKYRVTDHNGRLVVLCYEHKYAPEANNGAGGYEDVIAIKQPEVFRST